MLVDHCDCGYYCWTSGPQPGHCCSCYSELRRRAMLLRTTATVSGVCGRAVAAARRCTNSLVPAATVAATLGGRASQRATMASTAAAAAAAAPAAAASSAAAAGRRAAALEALRRADVVAFDVDSTVITVEAIDEFAGYMGKRAEVAAQTAAAMGGTVPFDVALEARLSLLRPTTAHLAGFLASHPFAFTPHVRELVAALRGRGATVYLVSGGFTQVRWGVGLWLCVRGFPFNTSHTSLHARRRR